MVKMKVFVGNEHKILYSGRGMGKPLLIGYVYEYDADEKVIKYWNSLKLKDQETLIGKAQKEKTDLRLLIREKCLK